MKKIDRLDIDLGKELTYEPGHGFVLTDMNDSIYFTDGEAAMICKFISEHQPDTGGHNKWLISVHGEIPQNVSKKWIVD